MNSKMIECIPASDKNVIMDWNTLLLNYSSSLVRENKLGQGIKTSRKIPSARLAHGVLPL